MNLVTRREALEAGLSKFFTGQPCPHGHVAQRYTRNNYCVKCSSAAAKAYNQSDKGRAVKKIRSDKWRIENREAILQWHSEYRRKLKSDALAAYGDVCACCGEATAEFLTIDHINGGGTKHRAIIGSTTYRWLRTNGYPFGYRVLCFNCNFATFAFKICPHQRREESAL